MWTRRGSGPEISSACYHPLAIPQPCKYATAAILGKHMLSPLLVITPPLQVCGSVITPPCKDTASKGLLLSEFEIIWIGFV